MTHPDPTAPTHRLEHDPGRTGELIRYARRARSGADLEAAAWNRLEQRWSRPYWPIRAALMTAAAAICVALALRWLPSRSNHGTANQRAPEVAVDAQRLAISIPTGQSTLADGSKIHLSKTGKAEARTARPGHTQILLARGSVELSVTPKRNSELLEVQAGGFLFRVVGTEFQVSLRDSGPHLDVSKGRVAVYDHGSQLASIGAGESWDSSQSVPSEIPEPLPADPQTRKQSASKPGQNCLSLAREGSHKQALECFDRQSQGSGLDAEVALYEGARLRRDVRGDLTGALSALREYTRRFPNGTFSTEASVTIVELEAARGNRAAALQESARILESGKARERATEIRLLRGRLHQQQGEYAQAITEYTSVIEQGGSLALRARVERAKCLSAVGRRDEAIAEYRQIQLRAAGPIAEQARKQLEALTSDSTKEKANDL
jgi:hypothetical protein